jgi:hypothetical protein
MRGSLPVHCNGVGAESAVAVPGKCGGSNAARRLEQESHADHLKIGDNISAPGMVLSASP